MCNATYKKGNQGYSKLLVPISQLAILQSELVTKVGA
jgi:hypothetical protein